MVSAIVGIRKLMDWNGTPFGKLFTQRELSWLDDVIPLSEKEKDETPL